MEDTLRLPKRSPLLPERRNDFFVCDVFDAALKGDMAGMEHPIFSVSAKPDKKARRYEHGPHYIEITATEYGRATVYDRDVLIYCISQLIQALNEDKPVSQVVRFKAHDFLLATNRMTNGQSYQGLKMALRRLRGTEIATNISTGDTELFSTFGLIEYGRAVSKSRNGRMIDVEVKLSDWVFNAIEAREVLTLSSDYFRLRKPLERRIYELARKHCGQQKTWRISLDNLQRKCGSISAPREFKRMVKEICEQDATHDHLPDYAVRLEGSNVVFYSRGSAGVIEAEPKVSIPRLDPDVYDMARESAPGWDVHMLEAEWRAWAKEPPRLPEAAFVAFCRKWYEKRGKP